MNLIGRNTTYESVIFVLGYTTLVRETTFHVIVGHSRWKATALKAELWVETVTEGGRRLMAAWRKEEVYAARHRQEKREATRLGNLLSQTGVQNFAKPHPLA